MAHRLYCSPMADRAGPWQSMRQPGLVVAYSRASLSMVAAGIPEISSAQAGVLAISTLDASNFSAGIASLTAQTYNKWGTITITAIDSTLSTQRGTSGNIIFVPKDFAVTLSTPPPARTFYYTKEEFSVTVQARDFNDAAISNYKGAVTFSASGLSLPADYTFVDSDAGSHIFGAISGSSDTSTTLSVTDVNSSFVSGASSTITIKSASIKVVSDSGPVGPLNVQIQVVDSQGSIITQDNSTAFTITISELIKNNSSASTATVSKVTVSGGVAFVTITDDEAETLTVKASAGPSLTPITGLVRFGTVSGGGVGMQFWREMKGGPADEEVTEE